jgi:hypothetical protein
VAAVAWFGAVQAQEFAGSAWAVGQRCAGLDDAGFRAAFNAGRIVRTHVLRPTWHLVAPADLRWMQALTAPRVHASNGPYYRRCGLDPQTLARGADLVVGVLAGGRHLTRAEFSTALTAGGVDPGDGLRLGLIVMWCELEALICSGAMRGKQHTYALVAERIPAARVLERDEALGELARRYLASHAPAQDSDFAWWSGLTLADAHRAIDIAGESGAVEVGAASPLVHLLPNYDEYVVAYQDRSALFPTAAMAHDLAGMGVLSSPIVLYRGQVAGRWKRSVARGRVTVSVSLRRELGKAGDQALRAAATRYGTFLGLPVDDVSGRIVP